MPTKPIVSYTEVYSESLFAELLESAKRGEWSPFNTDWDKEGHNLREDIKKLKLRGRSRMCAAMRALPFEVILLDISLFPLYSDHLCLTIFVCLIRCFQDYLCTLSFRQLEEEYHRRLFLAENNERRPLPLSGRTNNAYIKWLGDLGEITYNTILPLTLLLLCLSSCCSTFQDLRAIVTLSCSTLLMKVIELFGVVRSSSTLGSTLIWTVSACRVIVFPIRIAMPREYFP